MLPEDFSPAISLAYLLARTSDTIADTPGFSPEERIQALREFREAILFQGQVPVWHPEIYAQATPSEKELLHHTQEILNWLHMMPSEQTKLIRKVVETIISGQTFDLEWFKIGTPDYPRAFENASMLDDYTYRVAGCVGEFWTDLGFYLRGANFSTIPQDTLRVWGCIYGQGLQLINILRDGEKDRLNGRCYLPVKDPRSEQEWFAQFQKWHPVARQSVALGIRYSKSLNGRRTRAATSLPASLGLDTLALLKKCSAQQLRTAPKISRATVYKRLLQSFTL